MYGLCFTVVSPLNRFFVNSIPALESNLKPPAKGGLEISVGNGELFIFATVIFF